MNTKKDLLSFPAQFTYKISIVLSPVCSHKLFEQAHKFSREFLPSDVTINIVGPENALNFNSRGESNRFILELRKV